jgi:hypothetical protein
VPGAAGQVRHVFIQGGSGALQWLYWRAVVHGEEVIFEGKSTQEQYAAVQRLFESFDAKGKMKQRCVQKIHNT